ncbi:MAG: 2,4-dihydroxyhept-2-ene-1,7-dioic acid aldolase [Alphaproteobacteria bacterium]|nr:2,4-dihydroxyhept-2-ene-1,7-dioic acid aldolase [Alphaproteobacteria bacterium]
MMNILQTRIKNKQPIINGWLSQGSAFKAELMAKQGFHSITVDLQHGLQDYQQMLDSFHGLRGSDVVPMVRVAWNQPDQIMKALDAGALGIICPMVNSKIEAEQFAEALYYPPKGERSFGPIRAMQIYDNYYSQANEHIIGFAMIETEQAVNQIDEILSVKGINGLYIGPADLSISHGFAPGFDRKEPEMLEKIDYILAKGKQYNVATAIHTDDPDYAIKMIEKGFDMVTISSDIRAMVDGLQMATAPLKEFLNIKANANKGY